MDLILSERRQKGRVPCQAILRFQETIDAFSIAHDVRQAIQDERLREWLHGWGFLPFEVAPDAIEVFEVQRTLIG